MPGEIALRDEAFGGLTQRDAVGQQEDLAEHPRGEHPVGEAVAEHPAHHREAVGHLEPAEQEHGRAGRVVEDPAQSLDLGGQQQPGRRRQQSLERDHRRGRPVRRGERVVDVQIEQRRQMADQVGVGHLLGCQS